MPLFLREILRPCPSGVWAVLGPYFETPKAFPSLDPSHPLFLEEEYTNSEYIPSTIVNSSPHFEQARLTKFVSPHRSHHLAKENSYHHTGHMSFRKQVRITTLVTSHCQIILPRPQYDSFNAPIHYTRLTRKNYLSSITNAQNKNVISIWR